MFFEFSYSPRSICVTFTPDSLLRHFRNNYYHVAFTVLVSAVLRLPCTLKMVKLRFLFFSIKINVSLESFNFEKEICKKSKYSLRKWDDRFPPEVKVYF